MYWKLLTCDGVLPSQIHERRGGGHEAADGEKVVRTTGYDWDR